MSDKFILEGHEPVLCKNLLEWAEWYETADRQVALDTIGQSIISTIFLSLAQIPERNPPFLFETRVLGGGLTGVCERYPTWDESVAGHAVMVKRVESSLSLEKTP